MLAHCFCLLHVLRGLGNQNKYSILAAEIIIRVLKEPSVARVKQPRGLGIEEIGGRSSIV